MNDDFDRPRCGPAGTPLANPTMRLADEADAERIRVLVEELDAPDVTSVSLNEADLDAVIAAANYYRFERFGSSLIRDLDHATLKLLRARRRLIERAAGRA